MEPRALTGRTRAGRLRLVDAYLARHHQPSRIADIGYGASPESFLELASVFEEATVIGFETDEARLLADFDTRLIEGFGLPDDVERFDLVRAMNVLRGYAPSECAEAHAQWLNWLGEGGVLVEGTTTPDGDLACFYEVTCDTEQLVLSRTRSSGRGFAPWMLRDWLPKLLRRSVKPGTQEYAFFDDWTAAWSKVRGDDEFQLSIEALDHYDVSWEGDETSDWLVWQR